MGGKRKRRSGFLLLVIAIDTGNATAQIAMCATSVLCQMHANAIDMESAIAPTAWFAQIAAIAIAIAIATAIVIVIAIANGG